MQRLPSSAERRGSRSIYLLVAGLLALPLPAQVGGSPAVAPLAPGAVVPANPDKRSQYLNLTDGLWSKGEAAVDSGVDVGGVLGQDPAPEDAVNYVVDLLGGGWTPYDTTVTTQVQHWVGEIRRPPAANSSTEFAASFEIVGPDPAPDGTGRYAVVVLTVPPTHSNLNAPGEAPYVYPGDPTNYGLWSTKDSSNVWSRYPWPGADRVVEEYRPGAGSRDYDVFGAYIVPSAAQRPLVSTMQRYRQLRHIIIDRLTTDFGYAAGDIGFLVAGGSYGGLPAHLFPMLYPDEFHAGVDSAFGPSMRTVWNDQDSFDFFSSALGRGNSGAGYSLLDATDFPIFCRIEGTDYRSLSLVNRLALNREQSGGHVLRPLYLLAGDVDPVTHANDWVNLVDPFATNRYTGRYTPVHSSACPPHIYWSVIGKACHGDGPVGEPMYVHPDTTVGTHELLEALWKMIPEARCQIDVVYFQGDRPPKLVPKSSLLTTLEPHDHVLDRPQRPVITGGLLSESAGFNRFGHGTWLGWQESLVVRGQSIYVGSADGVITRFQRQTVAGLEPLVDVARSNQGGVDYDLGYGVWALAVGDIDNDGGDEVVAASYRRIGVFDALTLNLEQVLSAPFNTAGSPEPWLYSWPRRIQIGEINSANPGREIVFTTLFGKLVVLDKNLAVLAEHGEGGIRDLVVGPNRVTLTSGTTFDKPIYALSQRGHLVALEMDSNATLGAQGRLAAASDLQYGKMWDLEQVQWGGQTRLAGLFNSGPAGSGSIRIYDKDTLALVDQFGDLTNPGPKTLSPVVTRGFEPGLAIAQSGGTTYFVALFDQHLVVWDQNKNLVGLKNLATFGPAKRATAVAAGDLDGSAGDEIVVSTLAGHVVWFELNELLATTKPWSLGLFREIDVSGSTFFDHRTNSSLATTWALAIEQNNLLTNPSFESGLAGWNPFGNVLAETSKLGVVPRTGDTLAQMFGLFSGGFNVGGVFQSFPATAGDSFTLDCWTRHWSGDPLTGNGPPNDNWMVMKIAFFNSVQVEIGSTEALVLDGTSPTDVWIDNPAITAVAPANTAEVQAQVLFLQPGTDPGFGQVDDVCFGRTQSCDWLRAVDQTGTWWRIDPLTGLPVSQPFCPEVFEGDEPPVGIAWAGAKTLALGNYDSDSVYEYQVDEMGGGRRLTTEGYMPIVPGSSAYWDRPALETGHLFQGFWVFGQAGDARLTAGVSHAAWWGNTYYPNHVQALRYDPSLPVPKVLGMWHSTGPDLGGFFTPPAPPTVPDDGIALRTEFGLADLWTHQACRLGAVDPTLGASETPQAVVSGVDGKVLLLEPRYNQSHASDPIRTQSVDYGFGGMALAVGDIDLDSRDDVAFAPYYDTVDKFGNPAQATVRVLRHDGTAFVPIHDIALTGTGSLAYAPSGIALADFNDDTVPDILVTTLTGEMHLFDGVTATSLDFDTVEGSLGGFNSIIAADLDGDGKDEIYVAGSMGLRRFNQ